MFKWILYWVNKISVTISILICGVIYLFLPSVSIESLMNGTQSGKSFFFLYLFTGVAFFIFIRVLLSQIRHFVKGVGGTPAMETNE